MRCPKCGYQLSATDKDCPRCKWLAEVSAQPQQQTVSAPPVPPPPAPRTPVEMVPGGAVPYCRRCGGPMSLDGYCPWCRPKPILRFTAAPWRRLVAFIIDAPVLFVVGCVGIPIGGPTPFVFMFLYWAICHGKWGRTPGKAALRIRVVNEAGLPPGFWLALWRAMVLSGLGIINVATVFGRQRRAIHDYAAGTWVVDV